MVVDVGGDEDFMGDFAGSGITAIHDTKAARYGEWERGYMMFAHEGGVDKGKSSGTGVKHDTSFNHSIYFYLTREH